MLLPQNMFMEISRCCGRAASKVLGDLTPSSSNAPLLSRVLTLTSPDSPPHDICRVIRASTSLIYIHNAEPGLGYPELLIDTDIDL